MVPASSNLKVAVLSTEVESRNHYIAVSIARAFARHPAVSNAGLLSYVEAVDACRNWPVDLLVAVGGAGAITAPLRRAAGNARKSVLWTTEDPYEFAANQSLAQHFDYVFSNDAKAASRYKSPRASFLPLGASREIHFVNSDDRDRAEKLYDILFVGTAWPNRIALLNKMLARLGPNLSLKFGLSGNSFLPNCSLASLDIVTDFRVAPQEFAALAARSRVVLTLDRDFSASASEATNGSSPPPRIFEIGMSRTPQVYLTNGALLTDLYEPGKELIIAPTVEDAVKAIKGLLADPAAAARIGEAAYVRTASRHLYDHRVAEILERVWSADAKSPTKNKNSKANQKKRILSVSHNIVGVVPFGGVELYQEMVSKSLLTKYDFYELYPSRNKPAMILKHYTGSIEYETDEISQNLLFDHRREEIFQDILMEKKIDLVHFHHFLGGHSFAYPMIARALGVPTVTTAHDYFMLCSQFTLLNHVGRYCHVSDPSTKACDICLSVRGLAPPGAQARRREIMRCVLENVDRILHSTEYTRTKFRQIYPLIGDEKHLIVGMASSPEAILFLESDRTKSEQLARDANMKTRRLQVSILGNFTRHKGGQILLEMFFQMSDFNIDFYIDGFVEHEFKQVLGAQLFKNVSVRGQYTQNQLRQRLQGCDVSIHFSTWPETYCIAIDEARAAGLVPIVLGFGALGERIHDGVNGFCISPDHPYDLVALMARLAEDPGSIKKMKTAPGAISASTQAHLTALENVYGELLESKPLVHDSVTPAANRRLYFSDLEMRTNHPHWNVLDVLYDDNATFQLGEVVAEEQRFSALPPKQVIDDLGLVEEGELDLYEGVLIGLDEIVVNINEFTNVVLYDGCPSLLLRAWIPSTNVDIENAVLLGATKSYSIVIQERRAVSLGNSSGALIIGRFDSSNLSSGSYRVALSVVSGGGKKENIKSELFLSVGECDDVPIENPRARPNVLPGGPEKNAVASWFGRVKVRSGGGVGNIDHFGKLFSATGENVLYRNQYRSVEVRGWLLPKDKKQTLHDIKVELVTDGLITEFEAMTVPRADVAHHFNDPGLELCGFMLSIPARNLPIGQFRVSVVGRLPKGTTVTARVGTMTIV